MDLAKLTAEDFLPLVDEMFTSEIETDAAGQLILAEVQARPRADVDRRASFTLLFRNADDTVLAQGIYRLEHDSVGVLEIFLVPVQTESGKVMYEAVFN